jgi:hypothetical protein
LRPLGSAPMQLSGKPVLMHSWERPFRRAAQSSGRTRSCFAHHRPGLVLLLQLQSKSLLLNSCRKLVPGSKPG